VTILSTLHREWEEEVSAEESLQIKAELPGEELLS
jgi:hypothetical protein